MEKNKFETRFMSYGIVNGKEEVKDFIMGAEKTADLFFEDEKDCFNEIGSMMFNQDLGNKLYDEFVMRFTIGFCEGAIFHTIQMVSKLLDLGYSDEDIIRISGITKSRLESIRMAMLKSREV
ncbi:MAG: hypothetical protein IKM20_04720 [Erysipelotrichales bacterium]|nr:hypothetical protein [Erysipelotrichales bacterium]